MVIISAVPTSLQILRNLLCVAPASRVDNSLARQLSKTDVELRIFFGIVGNFTDAELQIGTLNATQEDLTRLNLQLTEDVLTYIGRRRGCEKRNRARMQRTNGVTECQICRPEVMPPLGDAVRFIDYEQ